MAPRPQKLTITHRAWALARPFATPREEIAAAEAIVIELTDGDSQGRAECTPLARFGESRESVVAALESVRGAIAQGMSRDTLPAALPPGAARNALDCAFWEMDGHRLFQDAASLAGFGTLKPVMTAATIGFGAAEAMAARAAELRDMPLLRLELGTDGDLERVRAVRAAAPACRLIVDANEGWSAEQLAAFLPALAEARVELVEQPLAVGEDGGLAGGETPVPLCADEAVRCAADVAGVAGRYAAVNVRLDKVGGLTEALAVIAEARRLGLKVMVGGGLGTSLGVAPALLLAQRADFVALDGPRHLAMDRGSALRYEGGMVHPPVARLWGGAE